MTSKKTFLLFIVMNCFILSGCEFHEYIVNILSVPQDKNGNKPRDIAKAFVEAARNGDYEKAAQYWTKDAMNVFQHGGGLYSSFEDFCQCFRNFSRYTISRATPAEAGYYWLGVHGSVEAYPLYFELVNDEWFLVVTDVSEAWHQEDEDESYGIVKIMPPHQEHVKHQTTQEIIEKIISIHRLDHKVVNPHWVELETDGSVLYRLAPGIHEIEYREVIGEPVDQNIHFVTKELVVQEGYRYILEGYQIDNEPIEGYGQ